MVVGWDDDDVARERGFLYITTSGDASFYRTTSYDGKWNDLIGVRLKNLPRLYNVIGSEDKQGLVNIYIINWEQFEKISECGNYGINVCDIKKFPKFIWSFYRCYVNSGFPRVLRINSSPELRYTKFGLMCVCDDRKDTFS